MSFDEFKDKMKTDPVFCQNVLAYANTRGVDKTDIAALYRLWYKDPTLDFADV